MKKYSEMTKEERVRAIEIKQDKTAREMIVNGLNKFEWEVSSLDQVIKKIKGRKTTKKEDEIIGQMYDLVLKLQEKL